ncbi:MAG: ZrgA family zinc uptake protein [Rubrivivax sp.]
MTLLRHHSSLAPVPTKTDGGRAARAPGRPVGPLRWAILVMLGLAGAVHAGPHVHGVAALDVAIDGSTLVVRVDMPLDSLVGFERAPRTAAERRAAAQALARMRDAGAWLQPDAAALCRPAAIDVRAPVLETGAVTASAVASGADDGHADLEAEIRFDCDQPARLTALRVGLAEAFPRVRRIDVQVAGPQGQSKTVLRGAARTVRLTR